MPIVWRLARPEFAEALDGEGARLFGGRWNSHGRRAVYASSHLSLAVLEVYVNIPPALRGDLPVLRAVEISAPDDAPATRISQNEFSAWLRGSDPLATSRETGDAWLERNAALILEVPSVVVQQEQNYILNPAHPRMVDVKVVSSEIFHFDPRLIQPER